VPQYSLRRHSIVSKEVDQEESHVGEQSRPRRSTRVKLEQHDSDEEKQEESEQAEEDEGATANKDLETTVEKSQVAKDEVSTFFSVTGHDSKDAELACSGSSHFKSG
jgi:ribosomal protein L9